MQHYQQTGTGLELQLLCVCWQCRENEPKFDRQHSFPQKAFTLVLIMQFCTFTYWCICHCIIFLLQIILCSSVQLSLCPSVRWLSCVHLERSPSVSEFLSCAFCFSLIILVISWVSLSAADFFSWILLGFYFGFHRFTSFLVSSTHYIVTAALP